MWQSWVKIEHYPLLHSRCCTAKFLLMAGLIHCVDARIPNHTYAPHVSPALNGSSALQYLAHGNAIQICNTTGEASSAQYCMLMTDVHQDGGSSLVCNIT